MKKDSLVYFALKFALIAAVLLAIFNFIFPYYRLLLRDSVRMFFNSDVQFSSRIVLTTMPYISLSALVLATPKVKAREKIKFIVLIFILFYFIDISFALAQVFLQNTSIKYYHVLVVQDFFTISLPIVFWFLLSYKDFGMYFDQEKK